MRVRAIACAGAAAVALAGCSHASAIGWRNEWPAIDVVDLAEAVPGVTKLPRPANGPQEVPPERIGNQIVRRQCTMPGSRLTEPCEPGNYRYDGDAGHCTGKLDRAATKSGMIGDRPVLAIALLALPNFDGTACSFVYSLLDGRWQYAGALLPSPAAQQRRGTVDPLLYRGTLETSTDGNPHQGAGVVPIYDHWFDVYAFDGPKLMHERSFTSVTPALTWPQAQRLLAATPGVSVAGSSGFYRVASGAGDRIGDTGPSDITQSVQGDGLQLARLVFRGRTVDTTPPAASFQLLYANGGAGWTLVSPSLPDPSLDAGYIFGNGMIDPCTSHYANEATSERCDVAVVENGSLKTLETGSESQRGNF